MILLAIAGFAAFNVGGAPVAPATTIGDVVWGEAAGAVSAQGWLAMAGSKIAPPEVAGPATTAPAATPQAAPVPSVAVSTGWLDSVTLRSLVEDNFAASDVNRAVRLAWCLSRFDVDAVDPDTGVMGLFQIAPSDWQVAATEMGLTADSDPFNPALNVAVAAHIVYAGNGWSYWDCS